MYQSWVEWYKRDGKMILKLYERDENIQDSSTGECLAEDIGDLPTGKVLDRGHRGPLTVPTGASAQDTYVRHTWLHGIFKGYSSRTLAGFEIENVMEK
ncbi:hypothetical protein RHMOL_Rhmol04G0256300 [Rhododendron molle]|uniref:Uncharacterized protein n=1 Tax=Rhododendron molle TaxID=49168 RepID=A0ACC0P5J9_RHOML|nr:hypothetical protein RHMOL_Rhmol04G0256300 [Rhododendron molle]